MGELEREYDKLINPEMTSPQQRIYDLLDEANFPRFTIEYVLRAGNEEELKKLGRRIKYGPAMREDAPPSKEEQNQLVIERNDLSIDIIQAIEGYLHEEL
jgi:hypothetical protein